MYEEAVAAHLAGDIGKALNLYQEILSENPDHVGALFNLGVMKRDQGDRQSALAMWNRVIGLDPAHYKAHMAMGRLFYSLRNATSAGACFNRALASRPDDVMALICLGNVARLTNDAAQALDLYGRALAQEPDNGLALANRGYLLEAKGRSAEAIDSLRRALRSDPTQFAAMGAKLAAQMRTCDWSDFEESRQGIREALRHGHLADRPFLFMLHTDEPMEQRNAAALHGKTLPAPVSKPLWNGERYSHDRIRIGYVSSDFRRHAISHLLTEPLEKHDRSRFEVFAYAIGPRVEDDERRRIANAVEHFVDVAGRSSGEIAALIRADEIDVLVDLNLYTTHSQPQIFSSRCAPIQINYLGYPGTAGTDRYDYIVADRHVIPPGADGAYTEAVIRMPNSYQACPSVAPAEGEEEAVDRAALGLPEQGFVFCCFNASKKLTPAVFDVWMALLAQVDGSVLWLLDGGEAAKGNLRAEARRRGVDPDRLVFAPRVSRTVHLDRHRAAGLFLDTWPYNAHTTANDALRMGLPVVTFAGKSFASRVGASLLSAVGTPELVTSTAEGYLKLAAELAGDPERLGRLRRRLRDEGPKSALFDTAQFTRDLEAAYLHAWGRSTAGLAPAAIDLASNRD